jgi:hypothetical protein
VPDELTVKIERFGPNQRTINQIARRLSRQSAVAESLRGTENRLLSFELIDPPRKIARPRPPDLYRANYYDYTNNRTIAAEGRLDDLERVSVSDSAFQPLPTREEFDAAIEILTEDPELGPLLREQHLQAYEPMPPLVEVELPDGRIERTVAVGLLPTRQRRRVRHEIVGVNMIQRRVERYEEGAPPTAQAHADVCGAPVSAGQATTGKGLAGQVWVNVFQGNTLVWRFLAVRPSASSGVWGSGVELRYVNYRGRRVLYRAHVPILNVLYDGNACGPYRDWQYQEGMLDATGTNVAPGFLLCPTPAKTILDTGSDAGTFLGTGIYVSGQEVVLVCELQAGWYRYISEWRLHANGTIRPRFGFDATSSSCVCARHHHHVYWRLDFDIQTPGNNAVQEFNDPAIIAGTNWHPKSYEIMRLRSAAHKRRWRVLHSGSGRGYTIVPGPNDGTAAGDAYAKGDVWFLRYSGVEIDDSPIVGTEIQIDKYRTPPQPLTGHDVVVWYGGHFTHEPTGPHVSHVVGPDLKPHNW